MAHRELTHTRAPQEILPAVALCENATAPNAHLELCKIVISGNEPPEWVMLVPAGNEVKARDGRKFKNSNPQKVVDAFVLNGADIPIDYEHATEIKAPQGEEAPAAGWIVKLEVRDGAVWGQAEWTPRGAMSITSREYRYMSPAFLHHAGEVGQLVSAALTNRPALHLPALASTHGDHAMDKELLKLLGLPENASAEDIRKAVEALKSQGKTLEGELANARSELATARAAKPDLEKFVPRADYELAITRAQKAEGTIKELTDKALASRVDAAIDAAVKAGKVAPTSVDFYKASCSTEEGLQKFNAFIEKAPVIAPDSNLDDKKPPQGGGASEEFTADDAVIAANCGLTKEQYLEAHKATLAR